MSMDRPAAGGPPPESYRLGTMIFLMAGVMFFAGLVAAYMVLRYGAAAWPAPGMPALPVRLAGGSTAVIILSSLALRRAVRALRSLDAVGLRRRLFQAAALGVVFLALQAAQWSLLLSRGLGFAATTYGAIFYVLTGAHAVHALGGIVWLSAIAIPQRQVWVPERRRRGIESCALYWHFVGAVWVCLYAALYLL